MNAETRPLIGLTVGQDTSDGGRYFRIRQAYSRAVEAAGGLPVLVPPIEDEGALRQLLAMLDGLLLPGGPDVHPRHYGVDHVHPATRVDPILDTLELRAAAWAIGDAVPTLGICRGQQLLNVALGGGLIQHLEGSGLAHEQKAPRSTTTHGITVAGDSRLASILGATALDVNSFHHQAVEPERLGRGVRAVAWSADGVIEGIESVDHPWLVAVQFHPEELTSTHEPSRRLFRAFVEACRRRRMARSRGA